MAWRDDGIGEIMRSLCIALVLATCVSNSARADDFDGQDNDDTFRQCVAQSARSTGSMLVFQVMQNACLKRAEVLTHVTSKSATHGLRIIPPMPSSRQAMANH